MLQGKKKISKTKEEEGDDSCCRLLREAALQRSFRRGRRRRRQQRCRRLLRCVCYNAIPQQEEEGDDSCRRLLCGVALQLHNRKKKATVLRGTTLQRNSTVGRKRQQQLSSPSLWSYTVATQEEEEGDDSCRYLLRYATLQA